MAACTVSAAPAPTTSAAVPPPAGSTSAAATPAPAAPAGAVTGAISGLASPSAAPAPTHDHAAQASPVPVAAASTATAAPTAAATTAPATPAAAPANAASPTPAAIPQAPAGPIAVTLLDSAIKLDRSSAAAGSVTFTIRNAGTVLHQLVLLRTDVPQDKIPSDPAQPAKVTQPGFITETKNMDPGTSMTLSLPLAAGKYVLMCNQLAHYLVGMHTGFTIN